MAISNSGGLPSSLIPPREKSQVEPTLLQGWDWGWNFPNGPGVIWSSGTGGNLLQLEVGAE